MRKLSIAVIAVAALFGAVPTFAADLALKAPAAPVAPAFNWNGWYAGLNIGGSFGRASDSSTFGTPAIPFAATTANLDGVIGGGQIGYNWLAGSVLFGLEADIQGSSERGTADPSINFTQVCILACGPGTATLGDTEKLPWFGTVRGRLGVTPGPNWLLYVTGGLAYGRIDSDTTLTVNGVPVVTNFSTTRAGWTVGGGVEGVITGNWTAKLEYLYMDFGTFSNTFTGLAPVTPFTLSTHVTDNIVRVGLNYHFH